MFARNRAQILGCEETELVNQAIIDIHEGRRKWNPEKVNIVGLIRGVIRSNADNFTKKSQHKFEKDFVVVEDESLLKDTPGSMEDKYDAKVLLQKLISFFEDDEHVQLLIYNRLEGRTKDESREYLDLDQRTFWAVEKRFQRGLKKFSRRVMPWETQKKAK